MKKTIVGIAIASALALAHSAYASNSEGLDGLFGMKFGKVMGVTEECETNNIGELAYEYRPEKMFKGYTHYVLFATPLTRQVSQIRAVADVGYDEIEEERDSTIRLLEMKFNRKARFIDDKTKAIVFDNNDYIAVIKDGRRRLIIDACCNRLRDVTKEEVPQAEKERYARDIKTLALLPGKEEGDDKIYKMDSVFGVKFGEVFKDNFAEEKSNAGAWIHKFEPHGLFMECEDYLAFATEKSKKIYMIRTVYQGDKYEARYDQIRRVIESVTGRKMRTKSDKDDNNLYIAFGDCLITLKKECIQYHSSFS